MIPACRVEGGAVVEKFTKVRPFTDNNGTKHPKNVLDVWAPDQLEAIGIYPLQVAGPAPKFFTRTITDSFDGSQGVEVPTDTPISQAAKDKILTKESKAASQTAALDEIKNSPNSAGSVEELRARLNLVETALGLR